MSKELQQSLLISPDDFFREKVSQASQSLKIMLDSELEHYLVQLLCAFIKTSDGHEHGGEEVIFGTPLVLLLQKAHESDSTEQKARMLRYLGDTSLYLAGFFPDYFNRRTFDIGYYIDMGSMAYSNLSEIMGPRKETSFVFRELAENFGQLVDLFSEVSESHRIRDSKDVLVIYDRWVRSNSDRLRKILIDLGIQPIPVSNHRTAQ